MQGPIHCAATIVREEGFRGLWSGASPTVLRNGTNQMCLFWAKNHMDGLLWSARLFGKPDSEFNPGSLSKVLRNGTNQMCLFNQNRMGGPLWVCTSDLGLKVDLKLVSLATVLRNRTDQDVPVLGHESDGRPAVGCTSVLDLKFEPH